MQYSNRYRSFDDHVQAAFDESLYIFEREYDYAASFKVISDALEMVEAGVTDRFVTSYEKLGSKFASNNKKRLFRRSFFIFK